MNELVLVVILVVVGIVFLISYMLFIDLHKNHRMKKVIDQKKKLIVGEKELDRTEAIKRGIHILKTQKVSTINVTKL